MVNSTPDVIIVNGHTSITRTKKRMYSSSLYRGEYQSQAPLLSDVVPEEHIESVPVKTSPSMSATLAASQTNSAW